MSRLGGFHILLKLTIKFFNHEALMSRKTHWIKYFGPPLVQLGARQGRTKEVAIKTQVVKWSILACVVIRARCYVFLLRAKWVFDWGMWESVVVDVTWCEKCLTREELENIWIRSVSASQLLLKKEEEHNRRPKKKKILRKFSFFSDQSTKITIQLL